MHAYHIAPIDFGWENLPTVADTAGKLGEMKARFASQGIKDPQPYVDVDQFLGDWESAKKMAASERWEGDFRYEPVVLWFPIDDSFQYGFAFKQDNNGSTFVISPVKLPWLD